jgi:hypothetical protein
MIDKRRQLLDCVTYYAIENWDKLTKKASHWKKGDYCTPVSVQLARKFKIDEFIASRIARDVSIMMHCGIVWKE